MGGAEGMSDSPPDLPRPHHDGWKMMLLISPRVVSGEAVGWMDISSHLLGLGG